MFCREIGKSVIYNRQNSPINMTLATPPCGQNLLWLPMAIGQKLNILEIKYFIYHSIQNFILITFKKRTIH